MYTRYLKGIFAALLIATLVLPTIATLPIAQAQTMSIALSQSFGKVGDKIVVSGTIVTYNGAFKIYLDSDASGTIDTVAELVASGTADGYSVSKEITIPNAYGNPGGRIIRLEDSSASPVQTKDAFFTVQTSYYLKPSPSTQYEGGKVTLNATITGGDIAWPSALDLRFRVKNPDGTEVIVQAFTNLVESGGLGRFVQTFDLGPDNTNLVKWGTYTAYLDWDDNAAFDESARQSVQSATFTIRLTDKAEYGRTSQVNFKSYVDSASVTIDRFEVVNPSNVITVVDIANTTGPAWVSGSWLSGKDTATGTYTVKVIKTDGSVFESQTFLLKVAAFTITFFPADFIQDSKLGTEAIDTANEVVQRMETVKIKFNVLYPNSAIATSADIPTGFKVTAFYNTTKVADISLDPLTAFDVLTNKWAASWKIPKDAVKGINYALNITASAIADTYGNVGPEKFASTSSIFFFKVDKADLRVTAAPSLVYPGAAASLQRTLDASASFEVKYPDDSRVTFAEAKWVNVTAYSASKTYALSLPSSDYNTAVGLWIAKWSVPYDAPAASDYRFKVSVDKIEDSWGNKGPKADTGDSAMFSVVAATLSASGLATDKTSYTTNDQVEISFKSAYPSGATVKTGTAKVTISGAGMTAIDKDATYDSSSGKWVAKWVIPTDQPSGKVNATIKVNALKDDAATPNAGPNAQTWVNFDLGRISLTDIMAAANAAKAAADASKAAALDAKAAADAAKLAADSAKAAVISANSTAAAAQAAAKAAQATAADAKTAADAAKTAATTAATTAAAAQTAANDAKTAANAASAAVSGMQGLLYAAVALALIAAIAAVIAVVQLQRKTA